MYKTSIAVAVKGGKVEVIASGDPETVLAAYRQAESDKSNEFVGYLRKPQWYKRNTPMANAEREGQKVIELAAEAKAAAKQAKQDAIDMERIRLQIVEDAARVKLAEERAKKAHEDAKAALQGNLDAMAIKEREGRIAAQIQTEVDAQAAIDSNAPGKSTEQLAADEVAADEVIADEVAADEVTAPKSKTAKK